MADVIDQSYTNTTNSNQVTLRFNATTNLRQAMRVTPTVTAECSKYDLWCHEIGSVTGNIFVKIYDDSGGEPNSVLATSDNVDASAVGGTFIYVTFTFSGANKIELTSGVDYYFSLEGDYTPSSTNAIQTSQHNPGGYDNGGVLLYSGGSWTEYATYDCAFKEYYDDTTVGGGGGAVVTTGHMTTNTKFWGT